MAISVSARSFRSFSWVFFHSWMAWSTEVTVSAEIPEGTGASLSTESGTGVAGLGRADGRMSAGLGGAFFARNTAGSLYDFILTYSTLLIWSVRKLISPAPSRRTTSRSVLLTNLRPRSCRSGGAPGRTG